LSGVTPSRTGFANIEGFSIRVHEKRGTEMSFDRTRRMNDPRAAAEAAFKKATTKPPEPAPEPAPKPVATLPNAKETVSLRIDRDILDHFQEAGPGWQDRINEALRRAVGK
jgi:uncharacterized protein (DUF4415 family)